MKLTGYIIFYLIFIVAEFLSFLYPQLLIKFDIMIPLIIYTINEDTGVKGILMILIFSAITGLSQGYLIFNISFSFLLFMVLLYLKNKLIIWSKKFILPFSLIGLTIKALLISILHRKAMVVHQTIPYLSAVFILTNGLLSNYIFSFVTVTSKFTARFYEKNTYYS